MYLSTSNCDNTDHLRSVVLYKWYWSCTLNMPMSIVVKVSTTTKLKHMYVRWFKWQNRLSIHLQNYCWGRNLANNSQHHTTDQRVAPHANDVFCGLIKWKLWYMWMMYCHFVQEYHFDAYNQPHWIMTTDDFIGFRWFHCTVILSNLASGDFIGFRLGTREHVTLCTVIIVSTTLENEVRQQF